MPRKHQNVSSLRQGARVSMGQRPRHCDPRLDELSICAQKLSGMVGGCEVERRIEVYIRILSKCRGVTRKRLVACVG